MTFGMGLRVAELFDRIAVRLHSESAPVEIGACSDFNLSPLRINPEPAPNSIGACSILTSLWGARQHDGMNASPGSQLTILG